ncbi:C-type lectin protein, partial [Aphelenchoides avenae]
AFKQKCTKCPPGYTFVPASGKCFKLHQIPKGQPAGWSNYRRACQSLPPKEWARSTADLASIHGVPAQNISQELAKKLGGKASVWIGLHQVGAVWKWSDDSNVDYKLWGPGQPDDWHKQDCVRLTLSNGHWDDIQCNESQVVRGAICQVLPICKRSPVATPKPTPKRTKAPRRTTPKRRPTPKATRRPPAPTRAATPKPTPKRTQPPRRTTSKRRPSPITARRRSSPPPLRTSPKHKLSTTLQEQNKPTKRSSDETPKPTTSKPRVCPCRKHKTTSHPSTNTEPNVSEEPPMKPVDCGEPPKQPQGPIEAEEPPKKPQEP